MSSTPSDPASWPPVHFLDTPEALHTAVEEWKQAPVLGVDCESNSFFAYRERLCLLQVTALGRDYVVDPIALGEELRIINPLLADPSQVTIFHSAEYDLMLLQQDLEADVRGLFDTQVAMTLLQYERTGLAHLLSESYGLEVSKKEQRSDWGKRPLSQSQIDYARTDTHYLPDLYQRLRGELVDKNMLAAADGENRRLEVEVLKPREPNYEGWKKMKQARKMNGAELARLRELFVWREKTAQKIDKPVFRVLANEALTDLAVKPARDMRDLAGRKGVGWPKAKRTGEAILEALGKAKGVEIEVPVKRVDPAERKRRKLHRENYEALRNWRKSMANELNLPSERLVHRRHLEEISKRLPRTRESLLQVVPLNDWQREHLEESLLALLVELPDPGQGS
ncbi:MAG: HRDC domain-containing protein [Planctomycetes bacterium]|nr:HRDC domain-containing protein [Planctomycetota bacterium]